MPVFVHKHLLYERSTYFKALIDNTKVRLDGHFVVRLANISYAACAKLARWVYGQRMWDPGHFHDSDLKVVTEIYDISCYDEEDDSTWDTECMETCLEAMKQMLSQKRKTLNNPIMMLERVLQRDDDRPGSAVILEQLVYGACAADGRTKTWLDEYCKYDKREAEVIELICLELAKKACE